MEVSIFIEGEAVLEPAFAHLECDVFDGLELALHFRIIFW
jgi:hypothetical protein